MKLLNFALASIVATVANAAATYTFTEPSNMIEGIVVAFSGFADTYSSIYNYRGMVLGIQEDNTNTDHQCYLSYLDLEDDITGLSDYFTALEDATGDSNTLATQFISNVWYRPSTYFKLLKRSSELGIVFFEMYDQCYFDNLIISFGRTINSFSGFFNTATTSAVYLLNLLDFTDTTNPLVIMYSLVDNGDMTDADNLEEYGLQVSTIIKNVFNIEVPTVEYQDF